MKNDEETLALFSFPTGWNSNKDSHLVEWTPPRGVVVYPRELQAVAQTWTQLGVDINGEAANDNSGYSVSLSSDGTVLAVGASNNDRTSGSTTDNRGHVRVYKYLNNAWTKLGNDFDGEGAGDVSGWSVSLSSDGTVLAVGAMGNNGNGRRSNGHVRVFSIQVSLAQFY